jgi:hypothetical protein
MGGLSWFRCCFCGSVSSILLKLTLLLSFVSSSELLGVLINCNSSLSIFNH